MAKVSKDEYLTKLNAFIGEETSEETLSLLEDITDSWPDKDDAGAEWEQKYNEMNAKYEELDGKYKELEETWRKRYRERFFDGSDPKPGAPNPEPDNPKGETELLTYEDFFKDIEVKE